MKTIKIFVAFFSIILAINATAQDVDTGDEGNDIDQLIDDNGMSQSFTESIWSLTSKDNQWKRPVRTSNGWRAERFNNSNSRINLPFHNKNNSKKTNSSNHNTNRRNGKWGTTVTGQKERLQEINNYYNNLRKKARERQQQEKKDNARNYREGYTRHRTSTSSFYHMMAQYDHYMAIEGARYLDNFSASDMINAPVNVATITSVSTMSGSDMADMLNKEKEDKLGSITFISEPIMTPNQEMGKDDIYLETDKPETDGDFLRNWNGAMEEAQPSLNLPLDMKGKPIKPMKEKRVKPFMILSHEELDIDTLTVFSIPKYGPVVVLEDSMVVLSDPEFRCISWNCGASFSYTIACGGRIFAKVDHGIIEVKAGGVEDFLCFDADEFSIFPGSDKCFYIIFWYPGYDGELSAIYRIELNGDNKNVEEIARVPQEIRGLAATENEVFLIVGDSTMLKLDQSGVHKFYESKDVINDVAIIENRLFVSTSADITSIVITTNQTFSFYNQGAIKLWVNHHSLYALDNSHDLLVFPNVFGEKK